MNDSIYFVFLTKILQYAFALFSLFLYLAAEKIFFFTAHIKHIIIRQH